MMMGRKGSDMLSEISEDRLLVLIAAYGADPLHWPESERTAAQQRAATDTPAIRQAGANTGPDAGNGSSPRPFGISDYRDAGEGPAWPDDTAACSV